MAPLPPWSSPPEPGRRKSVCILGFADWGLQFLLPLPRFIWVPSIQQCLPNFQLPSVKFCSAFCILIAFSLAFNEQSELFLYWGPAGKFQAESVHMKGTGKIQAMACLAVGRRRIAIHLRENVHLTRSLNSKEMSSSQLYALWQLRKRLEGGLEKITETIATAGKLAFGGRVCLCVSICVLFNVWHRPPESAPLATRKQRRQVVLCAKWGETLNSLWRKGVY